MEASAIFFSSGGSHAGAWHGRAWEPDQLVESKGGSLIRGEKSALDFDKICNPLLSHE